MATNISLDHVAVSVPNLEKAVEFYTEVFGFHMFASVDTDQLKALGVNVAVEKAYGPTLQSFKTAFLSTKGGVVIEIFEFQNPAYDGPQSPPQEGFQPKHYVRGGFFHIAVVAEDVEALLVKAEGNGAKRIGEVFETMPGQSCAYMWDPWGNVVEVMSCGLQELAAKALGDGERKQ